MLDFTSLTWIIKYNDGTIIKKSPQIYPTINRNKLEEFILLIKIPNSIIKKHHRIIIKTKGKTLLYRLRTKGEVKIIAALQNKTDESTYTKQKTQVIPLKVKRRVLVIALLEKNIILSSNKKYQIIQNKKIIQEYYFDPNLSEIHYIFEDGTIQCKNDFGKISPYLPIELRDEELAHLNG